MRQLLLFLSLSIALSPNILRAEEITIAAASDLSFAFKELVSEYETASGNQVKLTLGSSGNFFAQIQHGAPFDIYFSADIAYPKKLEEAGLTIPGSLYHYAIGRIVLWTRHKSPLDITQGIAALRQPSVKIIAIANPRHAPYGRAAVAAMEHFKMYDDVKDRLVLGENVSQAAQFVESGAADIGIIALSVALAPAMSTKGTYWEIPAEAHPPLEQGAVIIKTSMRIDSAKQFLEFVKSRQGVAIMKRYGFVTPESQ
ncbi:MAG: molybdate ABC transporter substrate-binding protein [Nitrospirae bacterium]|nr:molybdate ABC transporter substrate-binding protein [Nitrospirota bacterium]